MGQRGRGNGRQGAVVEGGAPIRPRSCVRKDGAQARKTTQHNGEVLGLGREEEARHAVGGAR